MKKPRILPTKVKAEFKTQHIKSQKELLKHIRFRISRARDELEDKARLIVLLEEMQKILLEKSREYESDAKPK